MTPESTIYALWCAWFLSWIVAMLWSSRTEKKDGIGAELLFRVLFYASLILLFAFPPRAPYYAQMQLWHFRDAMNWILVAPAAAGLLFTWWARIHLGRLWSDCVVRKAGHHVVDTGPYRLVRHPIYTGLIFAALATAVQKGTVFALLGVAVATVAFCMKARREERFLRAELGENTYDAYARRTAMLVPFVRTKGQSGRELPWSAAVAAAAQHFRKSRFGDARSYHRVLNFDGRIPPNRRARRAGLKTKEPKRSSRFQTGSQQSGRTAELLFAGTAQS